uniref:Uncharacterized protein n=1 Tax=Lotus japonicus TaxID=34305 RepID=I3SU49_LOTJA|nr:unknown [Lotus japonicus]
MEAAIAINACSTFVASFALVSIKGMPISSASALAVSYETALFAVRSDLLPTKSLLTLSLAYRSISLSHCFTLLKLSSSVTS